MGTRRDTAVEKGAAHRKLKLNKETVKDLGVKDGTAQAARGGRVRSITCTITCGTVCKKC